MRFRLNNKLIAVSILLCLGIFISDIFTPLGIADGISYIAVVLLTLWMKERKYTYIAGVTCVFLTLAGMFFSPLGESASIFITNRVLSILGIWTTVFAIIKYKVAEEASEKNRENLDALFKYTSEGIFITDCNGNIKMMNPEAEKQFGYRGEEVKGKNLALLLPGAQILEVLNSQDISVYHGGRMIKQIELNGRKKNRAEFHAEVRVSNFFLKNELNFIVCILDVTERKLQQEAVKTSNEALKIYASQLKETNRELENFAYISSHDLQEPLRKIQSFGDRLKINESSVLSEKGKEYVDRMLNASGRMQRLIDDLLSFSRLTSRARKFEKVNLQQVVNEVLLDLEVLVERNNASVHLISALPSIEADPMQMRQLFQNLVSNAIKFKKDDEPPIIKIYTVPGSHVPGETSSNVDFVVEDNGIGFDEKYLDKIFNIFQRLDAKKYEGSGIGLAICKKIVLRHQGSITAKSRPGQGARFIISLPLTRSRIANNPLEPINEHQYATT